MPNGRFSTAGHSSVMKTAMPKLTGTPMIMARSEVMMVPYTGASAPNLSVTGFQTSVVRKPKPKVRSAGQAPKISAIMTPPNSSNTISAKNSVLERKKLSCRRWRRP